MDIELFDRAYVYLEWSDKLEGKDCILAKTYQDLKDFVNSGNEGRLFKVDKGTEKPFTNGCSECDFCYFDNNLKVKKAWIEGKTIQTLVLNEWVDYMDTERTSSFFYNINWDAYEWRIKPTTEETWYVIFAENSFLRVGLIPNLSNIRFFSGTYEECGKWINEHKSYARILSAWKNGKIIQCKPKGCDFWTDWVLKEYPNIDSLERCDWRIKPSEEEYYLSVNKNDYLEFTISQNITNNTIYNGTRKECRRMMEIIRNEFGDCGNCRGEGTSCSCCSKLRYIIDKYSHEKYKRRMTNKELSKWLAKGNGEFKSVGYLINTSTSHYYQDGAENKNVDDNILIRDFNSDEWREPLIEV